jgi:hypothetical protein
MSYYSCYFCLATPLQGFIYDLTTFRTKRIFGSTDQDSVKFIEFVSNEGLAEGTSFEEKLRVSLVTRLLKCTALKLPFADKPILLLFLQLFLILSS